MGGGNRGDVRVLMSIKQRARRCLSSLKLRRMMVSVLHVLRYPQLVEAMG